MTRATISRLFASLDALGVPADDPDRTRLEMLLIDLRVRAEFRELAAHEASFETTRVEPAPASALF